jgi:hypothetical protein
MSLQVITVPKSSSISTQKATKKQAQSKKSPQVKTLQEEKD